MASSSNAKGPQWQRKQQLLKREGLLMRYKLGTQPSETVKFIADPATNKFGPRGPVATSKNHARYPFSAQRKKIHAAGTPCKVLSAAGSSDDGDDIIELERSEATWFAPCISPLDTNIGGLRCDPFQVFPVQSKGHVPGAFDYCRLFSRTVTQQNLR
jgi:hypothetical protein